MVLESLLQSGLDARLTMGGGIFVRGESDVSFDDMDYSKTASLLKPQLLLSFREGRFNQEREFHRQIQLMLVGYEATEALYKKSNLLPVVAGKQVVSFPTEEAPPQLSACAHTPRNGTGPLSVTLKLANSQTSETIAGCYSASNLRVSVENYVLCRLCSFALFRLFG